jgi:predicted nicotinamide N-methyase
MSEATSAKSYAHAAERDRADWAFVRDVCTLGHSVLVPEIDLLLARDPRGIWQEAELYVGAGPVKARPFWAFAWPGGQALARCVFDHPELVAGKRVIDLGSGSGLAAIAAARVGASHVIANDIDRLAGVAIAANARANDVAIAVTTQDILREPPVGADVILVADIVYEPHLKAMVETYLLAAADAGMRVVFADRTTGDVPPLAWRTIAEYAAPVVPALDDETPERARVLTVP